MIVVEVRHAEFERVPRQHLGDGGIELTDLFQIFRASFADRLETSVDRNLRCALDQLCAKAGNDRLPLGGHVLRGAVDGQVEEVAETTQGRLNLETNFLKHCPNL